VEHFRRLDGGVNRVDSGCDAVMHIENSIKRYPCNLKKKEDHFGTYSVESGGDKQGISLRRIEASVVTLRLYFTVRICYAASYSSGICRLVY
jgi:hypothetical protein